MKEKIRHYKLLIFALIVNLTIQVTASVTLTFPGWKNLSEYSPDIIIAHCSRTPDPYKDHGAGPTGSLYNSQIGVISILKGATNWGREPLKTPNLGAARMSSEYVPRQGEYYLIFSIYDYGCYQSTEEYRVVPLGVNFSTNSIAGKPLDEQLQILFKQRIDNLNREIQNDQEEKARLEEGLKK